MASGHLYGWNVAGSKWIKIVCNAAGKIIADITAFLEDTPTENLSTKAPTSKWAFAHKADVAAHHVKYTDSEARASINDLFDSGGNLTKNMNCDNYELIHVKRFWFTQEGFQQYRVYFTGNNYGNILYIQGYHTVTGYKDVDLQVHQDGGYVSMASKSIVDSYIATHKAIANAHHDKYLDSEAQAACNLSGTLYLTVLAVQFMPENPLTDDYTIDTYGHITTGVDGISYVCQVNIPDGATIKSVVVYGNSASEAETWSFKRSEVAARGWSAIGGDNINTVDSTLLNTLVDNSTYGYLLITSSLDTGDMIYGAKISYTL